MKLSGKVGNGPVNKWLNFGGDPDQGFRYGSGYESGYVSRHCLSGGMHCPNASSFALFSVLSDRETNLAVGQIIADVNTGGPTS